MIVSFLKDVALGAESIAFPKVCISCAHLLSDYEYSVCRICIDEHLEKCSVFRNDIILPLGVISVCSLWEFDKGGLLQELLHKLKYQHQRGIAYDLGSVLGKVLGNWLINDLGEKPDEWDLLSVPLHPSKERKRGYNQAFEIAKGAQKGSKCNLLDQDTVLRIKKTRTQTGFTLLKRSMNLHKAFELNPEKKLTSKNIIIVDDVFTTGATTFELCRLLGEEGVNKLIVITLAQA